MTNAAILIILNGDTEILNKQTWGWGGGEGTRGDSVAPIAQSLPASAIW